MKGTSLLLVSLQSSVQTGLGEAGAGVPLVLKSWAAGPAGPGGSDATW